ncbi:MAG TPA: DUF177 domain-containing protein, partial [Candidatus Limnocylindrales bacterium]|nr:DUF177 domain-containing protein [Candidatus Limnocylindrales bacterium]
MHIYLPEVKMKKGEAAAYNFEGNMADCFGDFTVHGEFKLSLSAAYCGDTVVVNGILEAITETDCSRCLETFQYFFETEFQEMFKILPGPPVSFDSTVLAVETANSLTVGGDYLYIDEYIRQLVILAQEYSPVCMPECKGICADCGSDLNKSICQCRKDDEFVDVRLLKLKELSSEG